VRFLAIADFRSLISAQEREPWMHHRLGGKRRINNLRTVSTLNSSASAASTNFSQISIPLSTIS